METQETKKNFSRWYDENYKKILILPLILLVISLAYLVYFYKDNGDFIHKDVSLSGGTSITVQNVTQEQVDSVLRQEFPDVSFTKISDLASGREIALIIETAASPEEIVPAIENILGFALTDENSTVEFTGSSLSNSFYKQLIIALIISFVLMSIVIFVLFKSFVPSIAVIFAAFADIVIPLAFLDILGVKISAAGIAAFLMLIGYSVDTDILLTSRALKSSEDSLNERIYRAFKTGIFMTLTALVAVLPAFFLVTGLPHSFRQIFLILSVGLFVDILNTWLTNASIIKWYANKKGIK